MSTLSLLVLLAECCRFAGNTCQNQPKYYYFKPEGPEQNLEPPSRRSQYVLNVTVVDMYVTVLK
jgi:hypothetical protein